ncbi:MAG: aminotransferase class V-fold PLP-dependent enzyme, partial [Planctomycetota bacterium]
MIYLDNHATTPCDPRVAEQMMPHLTQSFGNPHSTSHAMGRQAAEVIDQSMELIASQIGCNSDALLMTSGATESNNLAIDGVMRHPRQRRGHVITTAIEHPAVLDVVERLQRDGFDVSYIGVHPAGHPDCGQVDLDQLRDMISDRTGLVSIHWANNEIGVIQPMDAIAEIVHAGGALLHSDATQAVGRLPVDLSRSDI